MHNESCIAYGYARSVAVVRCLHPHLTEAFATLDDSVRLPLPLLASIHQLASVLQSEAQLEKMCVCLTLAFFLVCCFHIGTIHTHNCGRTALRRYLVYLSGSKMTRTADTTYEL